MEDGGRGERTKRGVEGEGSEACPGREMSLCLKGSQTRAAGRGKDSLLALGSSAGSSMKGSSAERGESGRL